MTRGVTVTHLTLNQALNVQIVPGQFIHFACEAEGNQECA